MLLIGVLMVFVIGPIVGLVNPFAGLVPVVVGLLIIWGAFRHQLRRDLLDFAMIASTAQGNAAVNLHKFSKELIDFDELQELWPKSDDPLLDAIIKELSATSLPRTRHKIVERAIEAIMTGLSVEDYKNCGEE